MGATTTLQMTTGATLSVAGGHDETMAQLAAATSGFATLTQANGAKATIAVAGLMLVAEQAAEAETTKRKVGFC